MICVISCPIQACMSSKFLELSRDKAELLLIGSSTWFCLRYNPCWYLQVAALLTPSNNDYDLGVIELSLEVLITQH